MKTCQSAIIVLAVLAAVALPTAVLTQAGPPNAPRGNSNDRPSSPAPARAVCFRPAEPWLDNHGAPINAHGGGILYHQGIYWWFGQHMVEGTAGNKAMVGVHVYSSTDLNHWQDHGIALRVSNDPNSEITQGCILERPKVILNRKTGQFVMWFHLELKGQGYSAARAGVAVSDTPAGPYRYLGSVRPNAGAIPLRGSEELKRSLNPGEWEILHTGKLPKQISPDAAADLYFRRDFANGHDVRDMTLYMDDDQTAYLIFASEQNWSLHVVRLSEDYLRPTDQYARVLVGKQYEAPAVLKHAGKYWLFGSHCTGWAPNPARLAVADSMFGPFQEHGNPWHGPAEQTKISFDSQSTGVLPVAGNPGAFIFLADRWRPKNAIDGRHIWVPVLWRDGRPALEWMDPWDLTLFDRRADTRATGSASDPLKPNLEGKPPEVMREEPASSSTGTGPVSSEKCLLFSYFVGNGEDGLHLASSTDGYKWESLCGGKSFLAPKVGKSKLMRDPCLLRAPDGTFQLLWSDSWDSRTIGHASSPDLLHWSEQQAIGVMEHEPQAMNCWAPELVYDETKQQYLIFWATTIPGRFPQTDSTGDNKHNHRMYATTTKDFKTFTPTRLFFDGGFSVIDATMLRAEGKYYLIVKDETAHPVKKNLRIAVGTSPEGPFGDISAPFTPAWVEGPSAIRIGDNYLVYFDCYRQHHYGAVRSRNLKDWEDVTSLLTFPKGTRHGTVLQVPKLVVDKLSEAQ